jgi:hypothetical protein
MATNPTESGAPNPAGKAEKPRARMHHYLPVSFLNRFTDARGFLHVLDFKDRKTFKSKPNGVAKIRDFYTVETVGAPEGDGIEKLLAEFESNASPVFERIIRENRIPLESPDWAHAIDFIALLDQRLPISREQNQQLADGVSRFFVEEAIGTPERLAATLKQYEISTGEKVDLDFQSARQMIDEDRISMSLTQADFVHSMLENSTQIAELIAGMTPHLLISEGEEFITGDSPLAMWDRAPHPFYGTGWAKRTIEVALPIGLHHCIVLTWDPEPLVGTVDNAAVANVNSQIAQRALRYTLGPKDSFIWRDRDGSSRTGAKLLFAKMSPGKINRKFVEGWPPRGKFGSKTTGGGEHE